MEKLLEYMLYREAGGRGYDAAINALAEEYPLNYKRINDNLMQVRREHREACK